VKIEINPAKWFPRKAADTTVSAVVAAVQEVQQSSKAAKAVESMMSTTSTPAATASTESGFMRFIDAIGNFFVKSAPVLEGLAVAAEPFLALSPFGPEYDLVVNAIIGVRKTATASLTIGATLTGTQQMALVLEAVVPGLTAILASKKVTTGIPTAINQFAQNVYNLQTGPTTTVAPTAVSAAKTA
jgi:hypothetical protein